MGNRHSSSMGGRLFPWVCPSATAIVVAFCAALQATPASAGIAISVAPNYPPVVTEGQTNVAVSVTITNNSADDVGSPGVDTGRTVTVDNLFHTPACDVAAAQCPMGSREPGVFQVIGPATGSGGLSGCTGTWTIGAPDAAGEVQLSPPSTLVLDSVTNGLPGARCTITFAVNVLASPQHDADPASAGVSTDQLARAAAHFSDNMALTTTSSGSDTIIVTPLTAPPRAQRAPAVSPAGLIALMLALGAWGYRRVTRAARGA